MALSSARASSIAELNAAIRALPAESRSSALSPLVTLALSLIVMASAFSLMVFLITFITVSREAFTFPPPSLKVFSSSAMDTSPSLLIDFEKLSNLLGSNNCTWSMANANDLKLSANKFIRATSISSVFLENLTSCIPNLTRFLPKSSIETRFLSSFSKGRPLAIALISLIAVAEAEISDHVIPVT